MNNLKFLAISLGLIFTLGINDVAAITFDADTLKAESTTTQKKITSKYGADSVNTVKNLSLYRGFYKQWKATKYKDAELAKQTVGPWRYCFFNAPLVSKNMYLHGVKLMKYFIKTNKEDSVTLQAYVDTLMMVYDQRLLYFGDNDKKTPRGILIGRKAQDYMSYRPGQSEVYYPQFVQSFEMMGNDAEPASLFYFYVASVRYVQQKHADRDLILENYVDIMDVLDYNLERYANDSIMLPRYTKVANNLEKNISKFASCEKLIALYGPKLEANPDDLKLAKNIVAFFEKRKCIDSDVYFKALEKVHAIEPTPNSAFSMGKMALERSEYAKAKTYLTEAANTLSDSLKTKKAATYLLLAETNRSLKQPAAARTAALNILNYNPNSAMAYIIIGDLYASSASSCTLQGLRVSYWAAADKYSKAIIIAGDDEKIKEIAAKKLAGIKKSFPEKQDVFMRNLTEGQTITIECWINETTTVRSRK